MVWKYATILNHSPMCPNYLLIACSTSLVWNVPEKGTVIMVSEQLFCNWCFIWTLISSANVQKKYWNYLLIEVFCWDIFLGRQSLWRHSEAALSSYILRANIPGTTSYQQSIYPSRWKRDETHICLNVRYTCLSHQWFLFP